MHMTRVMERKLGGSICLTSFFLPNASGVPCVLSCNYETHSKALIVDFSEYLHNA